MPTRSHTHEESFPVAPETLFAILHTPSAIRGWWSASRAIVLPETGGMWVAVWGDDEDRPDYIAAARIAVFDPPRRMVFDQYRYSSKDGPLPFEAEFVTEFTVTSVDGGAALRVVQDGFPAAAEADAFYAACGVGWKNTFAGIRRFLESGEPTQCRS